MLDIRADELLWAGSMLPEGIVERWFADDAAIVVAGDRLVEVRVEEALHEITAPQSGRLMIVAGVNSIIEPGSLLAKIGDRGRRSSARVKSPLDLRKS